jgi:hypothetical protein
MSSDESYNGPSIGGDVQECVERLPLPIPVEELEIHAAAVAVLRQRFPRVWGVPLDLEAE